MMGMITLHPRSIRREKIEVSKGTSLVSMMLKLGLQPNPLGNNTV
jgi:hypothetical protein